jgi:hypothetical protein
VTAKELLELNGTFEGAGVPYAIIGGMAVARNGAFRTAHNVDLLTLREGWERIRLGALPFGAMHPVIRRELGRILRKVQAADRSTPPPA